MKMSCCWSYSEKVPVIVGSKIKVWVMTMMTKGELPKPTRTWKQAHLGPVMSGLPQLPCTTLREDEGVGKEVTPSSSSNPAASRGFCLNDICGTCSYHSEGYHSAIWDC